MVPREGRTRWATIMGIFSCLLIASAFFIPWYGVDYSRNGSFTNRVEYSADIDRIGDLTTNVTIALTLSLVASVIAVVLSFLDRRLGGVVAGTFSAFALLSTAIIFYSGIVDMLHLDHFSGYTLLNRTWSVETAPMLGWWIALTVPALQGAQVVVLASSDRRDSRTRP